MNAFRIPAVFFLLLLWLLILHAAGATSMIVDEGMHLASGYTILHTGDYRMVEEHPPFVKLWTALPLLFVSGLSDPRELPAWEEAPNRPDESLALLSVARDIITSYRPVDRLIFPGRAMAGLLALILGAVVYRWAADLGGKWGGLLALLLLTLDPNILAHSAVVGTDLGAATTIAASLFFFARWLRQPTTPYLVTAGIVSGLALGTKTSAILILPTVFLIGILMYPRRWPALLGLLGIAGLTLWALYRFEVGYIPGTGIFCPAPSHAIPFLRLRRHMTDGHPAFLLGENRMHGWWYYFPVAFALKTPLPTLLFLAIALLSPLFLRPRRFPNMAQGLRTWGPIVLFPLMYGISTLFSPLNIGYRHLLPVLPFLFVLVGRALCTIHHTSRFTLHVSRFTYSALLAWLALGTLRIAPHYLAYFNELAGGPDNGWRYLADSNTDWGQGYKDLARFQKERHLGPVRLSAFIFYDPAIYGVRYEPLTPMRGDTPAIFPSRLNPPPGDYVISATTLDGIPLVDPEMYDWFRKREPDARIAHVLFYYHIPPQDPPPTWVAQCTVPDVPLSPEAVAEGFGRDDLRRVYFDCTQGWLYPAGGDMPGWYVFYRDPVTETPFARSHLSPACLSYEQKRRSGTPPFRVYEWPAGARVPGLSVHLVLPEGISSPVPLDGPLTFLGAAASRQADALEVETWWQVTAGPITRPLSIMAHLLTDAGDVLGLADGLGVSPVMWQPGDVIVQRHRFPLPQASVGLYLRTGAYWLDTMERWPLARAPEVNIMLISLPIGNDSAD